MAEATGDRLPKGGAGGGRKKHRSREGLIAALFLLPNLIGFLVFTAIPVGAAFVLAFTDYELLLGGGFVALQNFRTLIFEDEVFRAAFINTVYFTGLTVPLSVALGMGAALLANRAMRGVVLFRTSFLLPFVTLTVAAALVWQWMYAPETGVVNFLLGFLGIDGPAWLTSTTWAMPAIIIMSVWKTFGYNMVIFLAGLQGIPEQLYDAAKVDGANSWHRFWNVTVPMLSPTTFFVVVISIIGSFQVFDQAYIMTDGGPGTSTTTLVMYIYQLGFQRFQLGMASAAAAMLFATIFIFTMVQFIYQRRWVTYE